MTGPTRHTPYGPTGCEKCKKDRSLAIAHGLEDICEVKEAAKTKTRKKKKGEAEA